MWQPPTVWLCDGIFHQLLFHLVGLLLNTRCLWSQVKLFNNSSSVFVPCILILEPQELVLPSENENISFFLCVSLIINTKYGFHLLPLLKQQENFWNRGWSYRSIEKNAEKFWQRHVFVIHYFNPLSHKGIVQHADAYGAAQLPCLAWAPLPTGSLLFFRTTRKTLALYLW